GLVPLAGRGGPRQVLVVDAQHGDGADDGRVPLPQVRRGDQVHRQLTHLGQPAERDRHGEVVALRRRGRDGAFVVPDVQLAVVDGGRDGRRGTGWERHVVGVDDECGCGGG